MKDSSTHLPVRFNTDKADLLCLSGHQIRLLDIGNAVEATDGPIITPAAELRVRRDNSA
ncbi:MAG: hypothetical protein KAJ46_02090 [Sedimentisphaerales bacterium]|nr:hypothetical protein [Sedimentisphaerales bacterium]